MASESLGFDHIHLISKNADAAAQWYVDVLGGEMEARYELRKAPQIKVRVGNATLLIRGKRQGEAPDERVPMREFGDYSSHNVCGTDHFGYTYHRDLQKFCEEIKSNVDLSDMDSTKTLGVLSPSNLQDNKEYSSVGRFLIDGEENFYSRNVLLVQAE